MAYYFGMPMEYTMRVIRVDDYVAERLEAQADEMPPSYKEQADLLREQAQVFRKSHGTATVRIWQEIFGNL
jgi:hypothetical protein